MIANADGSDERVLAERQRPAQFVSLMIAARPSIAPTWSPNGRLLAIAGAGAGKDPEVGDVAFIDVESGGLQSIALPTSAVRGLLWFDDTTLLLNAAVSDGSLQLHQLTYPGGELKPLTRDVSDYDGISLAADRQTLVASRRERHTDLAILDTTGRTVTSGPDITDSGANGRGHDQLGCRSRGVRELGWAPGGTPQQLLRDADDTTTSPDGRTFVFSRPNGLWKADSDGGREMLLTPARPSIRSSRRQPVDHLSVVAHGPAVSLDHFDRRRRAEAAGRRVRRLSWRGHLARRYAADLPGTQHATGEPTALMCDLPDCTRQRYISTLAGTRFRWTPDGRRIAYIDPRRGPTSGRCPWTEGRRLSSPISTSERSWTSTGRPMASDSSSPDGSIRTTSWY